MRRSKTHDLKTLIEKYLEETGLRKKLKEVELINSWEEVVGPMIANRTRNIRLKDGKLILHLQSSVVKNELLLLRETLRTTLNERAGEELVKEIILK